MKMKKWIACLICVAFLCGMRLHEPDNRSGVKKF